MAGNGSETAAPGMNGRAYPIEDHTYDVIVVGAGGSGLRAVVGCSEAGCAPPVSPRSSPHTLAHGRGAGRHLGALGNMGRTTGAGTFTTP